MSLFTFLLLLVQFLLFVAFGQYVVYNSALGQTFSIQNGFTILILRALINKLHVYIFGE